MINTQCFDPKKIVPGALVAAFLMLIAAPALAGVPISITQQGKLLDDDGQPLSGEHNLTFALYDHPTDGAILWSDQINATLNDAGVYSVRLGDEDQPIDAELLRDGEIYLGLTVGGSQEMSPRLEMTSVPFASLAQRATMAETAEFAEIAETAEFAETVADGAVDADALADGAVGPAAVDAITWDQIDDVPADVAEPTDTLAELSCSDDDIALFDGSYWQCATVPNYTGEDFALSEQFCGGDQVVAGISSTGQIECISQQDTTYSGSDFATSSQACPGSDVVMGISASGQLQCVSVDGGGAYTAGTGLNLSGDQFSVDTGYFDSNYHQQGEDIFMGSNDLEFSSAVGRIQMRDTSFRAATSDRVMFEDGDLSIADGDLGIGTGVFDDMEAPLHISQSSTAGAVFQNSYRHWRVGTASTDNLWFQYTDDVDGGWGGTLTKWLTPDGEWMGGSDQGLKHNVEPVDGILTSLLTLQPTTYNYRHRPEDRRVYGFIAQDVAEHFPALVDYEEESDHYGLAYSKFGVLAIQGIREQQRIIDEQRDEIETLHREIDSLDQRLQKLEETR